MARGMTDYGSVRQDLSSYLWDTTLVELEVVIGGKGYVFRGQTSGVAGKVFQVCGVALPPALRSC